MPPPRTDQPLTSEQLGEQLDELDEKLTILQVSFEKYFLGLERRAPDADRKQIGDRIRRMRTAQTNNTGLRFRIQGLFARLLSYERMWDRTLREMEEGTYRRDVFKARMRVPKKPEPQTSKPPEPAIADASRPPPPPRDAFLPPPTSISDESLRRLFHTYVKAREQCGEATAGLTYESVANKIRAQVPQLMEKHGARSVEFKVVIKGGKAVLKAVPKL